VLEHRGDNVEYGGYRSALARHPRVRAEGQQHRGVSGSQVGWVMLLRRRLREKERSGCLDGAVPEDGGLGPRSGRARWTFFAALWCLFLCCAWRMLPVFGRINFDDIRA